MGYDMVLNNVNAGLPSLKLATKLADLITAAGLPLITVQLTGDTFEVVLDNPTDEQQAQADTILASFNSLDSYKADRIDALNAEAVAIVENRYPPTVQTGFAVFLATGNAAQKAYCSQLFSWGMSVTTAYATAKASVLAAPDKSAVDSVNLDVASLLATDPTVTLIEAASMA